MSHEVQEFGQNSWNQKRHVWRSLEIGEHFEMQDVYFQFSIWKEEKLQVEIKAK